MRIRTDPHGRIRADMFLGTGGMGLPGSARLRPGPSGKLLPRPLLAVHCRREMFDVMCNIPKDTSMWNAAQCFFCQKKSSYDFKLIKGMDQKCFLGGTFLFETQCIPSPIRGPN